METTATVDDSATPAKHELLARAHAAAFNAVMAHRIPFPCDKLLDGDDLAELFGPPLSAPAPVVPVPRRQRKRSLSKVCEAARKAGADRVIVDGVVIALSPAAAVSESGVNVNEWDAVLPGGDHGPH
jgi:hypothetical protein